MNKKLILLTLSAPLFLSLSGCFGEDLSCSSDKVSERIEKSTVTYAQEQFIANTMHKEQSFSSLMFSAMMEYERLGMGSKDPSNLEGYPEAKAKMEKAFKKYSFTLHDVRTTAKEKEINKVECVADVTVKAKDDIFEYTLHYNAQLGDDNKKIYVDILELK